jgi:hypothetical protein
MLAFLMAYDVSLDVYVNGEFYFPIDAHGSRTISINLVNYNHWVEFLPQGAHAVCEFNQISTAGLCDTIAAMRRFVEDIASARLLSEEYRKEDCQIQVDLMHGIAIYESDLQQREQNDRECALKLSLEV